MAALTDVHQHVLWGLDDGPRSPRMMQHMLDAAAAQNIRRICATPHAVPGLQPFDNELYAARLEEARHYCVANGLDVEVLPGAEVAWTYYTVEALRKRQIPTLNNSDTVLIEFWPSVRWYEITDACKSLLRAGCKPLIAHVERYYCFQFMPVRALRFRDELSVGYQLNAESVLYSRGMMINRFVRIMLEEHGFDAVASDAHDMHNRPQRLSDAHKVLTQVCDRAYADSLVNYFGA